MLDSGTYSITNSLKSGVDLYGGTSDVTAGISILITSNIICKTREVVLATSQISISTQVFVGRVTHNASTSISTLSSVLARTPIIFTPSGPDAGLIRTLIYLDGKPITNHKRTLQSTITPVMVETKNWNAENSRYYKRSTTSGREQFILSWGFLPNQREKTVDLGYARDYISSIAEDPDVHVLKIVNQDETGTTPYTEETYNVFVKGYDETLVRRDLSDGVYYFDCQLTLEEV